MVEFERKTAQKLGELLWLHLWEKVLDFDLNFGEETEEEVLLRNHVADIISRLYSLKVLIVE